MAAARLAVVNPRCGRSDTIPANANRPVAQMADVWFPAGTATVFYAVETFAVAVKLACVLRLLGKNPPAF